MLATLAVVAVALTMLTIHSAAMGGMDGHAMSGAAVICLAVGSSVAIAGVAVFAVRRLAQRPLWLIPAPLIPSLPFIPGLDGLPRPRGPATAAAGLPALSRSLRAS